MFTLGGSDGKASVCNAGDPDSIPGLGSSPGEGKDSPLQYSCLENPIDRGAWCTAVHGVTKSQTWLSDFTFTLVFSMYSVITSLNSNNFPCSFQIWISFISFCYLIAVVRTSNTLLNKSIESGHLCFVSDLKENVFSFSPLSMMLTVGLSYMAFIMLR